MKEITRPANLNPRRRQRSYPRVVKRHRHANLYRRKKTTDTGTRHHAQPTIRHHPVTPTRSN